MTLKKNFTIAIVLISMIVIQSCNNDDANNPATTARVQLKLVDLPGDYLAVNVNIVDVQYNNSEDVGGWKSFKSFEGEQVVNLTDLVGGVNLVLSNEVIPAGTLKQIRLILGDGNNVVVEGQDELPGLPIALDTPSAQQSGLKLILDTELEAGFSYTFILDWDVQKSIIKTGSGKYILKPVIRVQAEANTGAIEGTVTGEKTDDAVEGPVNLENVLVKLYKSDANEGDEPYATTLTSSDGYFIFEGLPTVDYKIVIDQDGYDLYETTDVTVKVNEILPVGTIALVLQTI